MAHECEGESAAADRDRQQVALAHAIEALPPDERAVFILRYVKQLPTNEVARRLEVSVGEVRERAVSALKACRIALEPLL